MVPGLIIAAVVILIAAIIIISIRQAKKRTEALSTLAGEMGFSFTPKANAGALEFLKVFHLFFQGHSRKMSNVMQGSTDKLGVTILDYSYTVGGGKNSQTYLQTVSCVPGPGRADGLRGTRPCCT